MNIWSITNVSSIVHNVLYNGSIITFVHLVIAVGFPATENWLRRNRPQDINNTSTTADQTISNAYMELMDWADNLDFPEVLSTDKDRILKLGQRAKRLCIGSSLIAICSAVPIISQRSVNRIELARQVEILLQNVTNEKYGNLYNFQNQLL